MNFSFTYFLARVVRAIGVVWAAFTVAFVILYLLPGDPVTILLGTDSYIDPAKVEALRSQYRLDDPLLAQYSAQLFNVLRGDLGTSIQNGAPVSSAILTALPETLKLSFAALFLAVLLAVSIAFASTYTRANWLRRLLLSIPPLGVALPTFWVGLLLIQVFSFHFAVLPAVGNAGLDSLVLPAITLALPTSAGLAKVFAQGLDYAWSQPYIDTAKAKGVSRRRILFSHAAKNALLPASTLLAITFGNLLAGAVVTETVFSRVGIGRLTESAVAAQDTPTVQGLVLLVALIFALLSLATDLVLPLLDPRIQVRRPATRRTV
ncbi:ABC transporter permease [Rhodococcus sp. NPDC060176]|uniref:ABC transporter permease n=1 Tax=Rhodococcus sp. NPDC060176 TaxID=3347062 RepID=UPI003667DBAC